MDTGDLNNPGWGPFLLEVSLINCDLTKFLCALAYLKSDLSSVQWVDSALQTTLFEGLLGKLPSG